MSWPRRGGMAQEPGRLKGAARDCRAPAAQCRRHGERTVPMTRPGWFAKMHRSRALANHCSSMHM